MPEEVIKTAFWTGLLVGLSFMVFFAGVGVMMEDAEVALVAAVGGGAFVTVKKVSEAIMP